MLQKSELNIKSRQKLVRIIRRDKNPDQVQEQNYTDHETPLQILYEMVFINHTESDRMMVFLFS